MFWPTALPSKLGAIPKCLTELKFLRLVSFAFIEGMFWYKEHLPYFSKTLLIILFLFTILLIETLPSHPLRLKTDCLVRKWWLSYYTWHDLKLCKYSGTVVFFWAKQEINWTEIFQCILFLCYSLNVHAAVSLPLFPSPF